MSATEPTRRWVHQPGDRYVILKGDVVGNPTDGFVTEYTPYTPSQGSVDAAYIKGVRLFEHDDFNIGVLRETRDGQKLVATLWHNEIVDDDPLVVASIAEKAGL